MRNGALTHNTKTLEVQVVNLSYKLISKKIGKKQSDDKNDEAEASVEVEAVDETQEIAATEEVEAKVDEEVLETVQAEDATPLSVESDVSVGSDEGLEVVRAGLQDWVQTVILDNNN